jgi:aminoglycoside phosphotransferase (APT) family kinase protein
MNNSMNPLQEPPSRETITALLDVIAPGSAPLVIDSLPGSFSNSTHFVDVRYPNDYVFRIVVRRYAVFADYDRGEKARREFKTLKLLKTHGIPVPQPLYLDDKGKLLGTPGIVTRYVAGELVVPPSNPPADSPGWVRALATMLTRIHSIFCDSTVQSFLLDANAEATWFARSKAVPDYMKAHPDGALVWKTVRDRLPDLQPVSPALVHIDYWPGNILWDQDRITAVVDWEEAAYGDPGIDVAYCRMQLALDGMDQAADEFLAVYEADMGPVANLGFWELAAAARPMLNPVGWVEESPARERFRQFIADAQERLDA